MGALKEDIECIKNELMMSHKLEMKQVKKEADRWKQRSFTYKKTVNELIAEHNINSDEDKEFVKKQRDAMNKQISDIDDDNPHSFNVVIYNVEPRIKAKLKPLNSFSPRSQLGLPQNEKKRIKSPRFIARKARKTVGDLSDLSSVMSTSKSLTKRKRKRTKSPINATHNNDPFDMTASQEKVLNSMRTKIRGGGQQKMHKKVEPNDFERDVQCYKRSPIKIKRNASGSLFGSTKKKERIRRGSLQLKGSLPAPSRSAVYSSDDNINKYSNDKSRSPVPVLNQSGGSLVQSKSSSYDEYSFESSPNRNILQRKASSPLPPPPRAPIVSFDISKIGGPKAMRHRGSRDADQESSDDDDTMRQFTSPAGSFFNKVKNDANDDEDAYNIKTIKLSKPKSMPKRRAVSMPEPSDDDSSDDNENKPEYMKRSTQSFEYDHDYTDSEQSSY